MSRSPALGNLSVATEDYLRAILALSGEGGATTLCRLADRLAVSRPSATQMVRRLVESGFVSHDPYRQVTLTAAGLSAAQEITDRHGLVTQYLVRVLGYPEADAFAEADQLEHALSERLQARITARLSA